MPESHISPVDHAYIILVEVGTGICSSNGKSDLAHVSTRYFGQPRNRISHKCVGTWRGFYLAPRKVNSRTAWNPTAPQAPFPYQISHKSIRGDISLALLPKLISKKVRNILTALLLEILQSEQLWGLEMLGSLLNSDWSISQLCSKSGYLLIDSHKCEGSLCIGGATQKLYSNVCRTHSISDVLLETWLGVLVKLLDCLPCLGFPEEWVFRQRLYENFRAFQAREDLTRGSHDGRSCRAVEEGRDIVVGAYFLHSEIQRRFRIYCYLVNYTKPLWFWLVRNKRKESESSRDWLFLSWKGKKRRRDNVGRDHSLSLPGDLCGSFCFEAKLYHHPRMAGASPASRAHLESWLYHRRLRQRWRPSAGNVSTNRPWVWFYSHGSKNEVTRKVARWAHGIWYRWAGMDQAMSFSRLCEPGVEKSR